MVQFLNMNVMQCPHCGCKTVVSESIEIWNGRKKREMVHCNGQKWETRKFLCGFSTQWVPNFAKAIERSPCQETKEYKATQLAVDKKRDEIRAIEDEIREILSGKS